ncbi:MAG: helix-turn-helix transcriptional regulator [Roseburia sp.]|nr:helix-turn-helix transcriptional regulator [Roseburia sp.]
MAEALGVSVNTIQNWEAGGTIPKSKYSILGALETNPHIVFGGQHVENGDAVNGDKVIESPKNESSIDTDSVMLTSVSVEKLIDQIARMQGTIDTLIAQQAQYITIIANMTNR